MKKVILLIAILTSNALASACYTAVNGFIGVYNVAEQMATQTKNTSMKLAELNQVIMEVDQKIKEISAIEESIQLLNQLKYEKNKSIINYLKAKNELRNNSITIDQIIKDLEN